MVSPCGCTALRLFIYFGHTRIPVESESGSLESASLWDRFPSFLLSWDIIYHLLQLYPARPENVLYSTVLG